jgi:hypothetical protein
MAGFLLPSIFLKPVTMGGFFIRVKEKKRVCRGTKWNRSGTPGTECSTCSTVPVVPKK